MQDTLFTHRESPSSKGEGSGSLAGVRVLIQPNLSVKGWPAEAGSLALENHVALEDAAIVEKLHAAGAVITGSTRMGELGLGLSGDKTAEALAVEPADAAIVTDTMGEARYAALAAGFMGFKPSYGICSRLGLIGLVPSMESPGILSRSPETILRIMAAISGPDKRDFSMLSEGFPDFTAPLEKSAPVKTAGILTDCYESLDREEAAAFKKAAAALEKEGISIRELRFPDFPLFRKIHNVIGSVEASSAAGKYDSVRYGHRAPGTRNWNEMYIKSRQESFGPMVKAWLFQGAYFQFSNYEAFVDACRIRRRLLDQTNLLFREADILLLPTRRRKPDAFRLNTVKALYEAFELSCMANLTGMPAISLPGLATLDDQDLGLQAIAPFLHDPILPALARMISNPEKGNLDS